MVDLFLGLALLFSVYKLIQLVFRAVAFAVRGFWEWLAGGRPLRRYGPGREPLPEISGAVTDTGSRALEKQLRETKRRPFRQKSRGEAKTIRALYRQRRARFLDELKLTWYQLVVIFLGGSVLGLGLEQVWMLVTAGLTESRVGLVWGPFSPLYGFGAAFVTVACFWLRKKRAGPWQIFFLSAAVGGALEQLTGWGMETLFHARSWSYAHLPDAITAWVAWRFLFFWGLLGLFWAKWVMPELLWRIGALTTRRQYLFVLLVALYLFLDIWMTLACFQRKAERDAGVPPASRFEAWIDGHYDDSFIAGRFQNLVIEQAA